MGHIRDLPASQLGIDVEHGYTPQYISIKGKEKLIKELKSKAKHADGVLLADVYKRQSSGKSWTAGRCCRAQKPVPARRRAPRARTLCWRWMQTSAPHRRWWRASIISLSSS